MKIEYLVGSEEGFYNFVESINKKDKIGILIHNDLDGFASGIFLEEILNSKGLKKNYLGFLGWSKDSMDKSLSNLRRVDLDKLFILDLNLDRYTEIFYELRENMIFF